jgi:hypothetical protein
LAAPGRRRYLAHADIVAQAAADLFGEAPDPVVILCGQRLIDLNGLDQLV